MVGAEAIAATKTINNTAKTEATGTITRQQQGDHKVPVLCTK